MQDVQNFVKRVLTDTELKEQLAGIGEAYCGDTRNLHVVVANNVIPTAKKLGYHFTPKEYVDHLKEMAYSAVAEALTDDELLEVAGGTGLVSGDRTELQGAVDNAETQNDNYLVGQLLPGGDVGSLKRFNRRPHMYSV